MLFSPIQSEDIIFFEQQIGSSFVFTQEIDCEKYSHDHTEDLKYQPQLVLLPANSSEISIIMKYCFEKNICVTPRGAGTGLSGGALPIHGGIILSTERLNKILKIDKVNFQATVECGVINEELQQAVIQEGLFYPPDPASKGSCYLGGNVAHASGGPRALKYGTTRDYILNLEVVLPTGEIIWTGANTLKYSTGYNLTHLMIGSEGTLGIVTKIVLKLIAYPNKNMLLLASFKSPVKACEAVAGIFMAGCSPSVCEFIEPDGFRLSSAFTGLAFEINEGIEAYLLIEVDGNDEDRIMMECEKISEVLTTFECADTLIAYSTEQKEYFWKLRRTIGESTKHNNTYKEEDTVVPRGELPKLFNGVKEIASRYHVRTVCYGHAGDGNLHVNILKDDHSDLFWQTDVKEAIKEIFLLCKSLGGTISGEHGIGLVQKEFMSLVLDEINLELMRKIKSVFDPKGILNPGKIF
ncbi:MAG TPA: FAD-linked oxidase C-terminal domain-containing protein [Chitinophagaceae bacterium]|nr:FAD-linked oxidase C-terminal domain-containing protein [Chitinophagaceae bacterium]